ncbi:MerR family transcriptional regulator [Aureimonas sp. SA4125]|uniref:MerR family transcriptional regulator n=1 Tax=Aureimonas sp. SA4125 TaxID=2826993 RepID=UPI001CC6DA81|nr:MerR family transcriptional regulator [Aureimonas sp. SA4125]BDA84075.1 MerR family transcriptional regulator [Aureimonas sp. SA4125]
MPDKSIDAFRTISEVAEDLNLPQHVLRFWETRFAQIKPMKRGGGRRYYRPDDVELLKGIRFLLYVKGFTIKGVQRILKESGNRFVMALGSGDMSGLETLEMGRGDASDDEQGDVAETISVDTEEDELPPPAAKPEAGRSRLGLSGLLRRDPEPGPRLGMPADSAQTLQDVLMELLECKRLLDQVR